MTKQLIVAPRIESSPQTCILPEGVIIRDDLINRLSAILEKDITSTAGRDQAIETISQAKAHAKDITAAHKELKQPFKDACDLLDKIKRDHNDPLEAKARPVELLIGTFNQREQDKVNAERHHLFLQQQEIDRKKKEALDKQTKLDLEGSTSKKAVKEALKVQEQVETADTAQDELDRRRIAAAEQQRASRASGGAQKTILEIHVSDLAALYKARPDCVTLTENTRQIQFIINNEPNPEQKLPGVTWIRKPVFHARARK